MSYRIAGPKTPAFNLVRQIIVAAICLVPMFGFSSVGMAQDAEETGSVSVTRVSPVMPEEMAKRTVKQLSTEELSELRERVEEQRERLKEQFKAPAPTVLKPIADPSIKPVTVVSSGGKASSGNGLFIGRNERNRIAEFSGALSEPAAINNRNRVFYTGNFHFEESTDHGVTYTATTVPPGPDDAPTFCCDNDVIVDPATGLAVHIVLYVDGADNGVLGIHVRNANNYSSVKCTYYLDSAGAANNEVQDYPKASQSLNFVYISASVYGPATSGYSRMYRLTKAELLNCADMSVSLFDQSWTVEGQRVWRPAGGGEQGTVMMWAHSIDDTHMRVFKWPELKPGPTSVVRVVSPSVFGPGECRGGVGNFAYHEGAFPAGFTMSCALASGIDQATPVLTCFDHSLPVINRPQAFLRGTTFNVSDRKLVAEPDLYSNDMCLGYPILSSNTRGNIGFSLAAGGNKKGNGSAVQGYVGLRTPTGTEIGMVAGGIANQASGRFGDYFTIHRYQGCPKFFGATSYAWDQAPVVDNQGINARWVEFGRFADAACWQTRQ